MADRDLTEYGNVIALSQYQVGSGKPLGPPLQAGGGGGTFDGMEARVARLEADVEHIKNDISEIKNTSKEVANALHGLQIDFASLKERVTHLPSKGFIVSLVSGGVVFLIGVLTLLSRMGWLIAGTPTH
jgi:hypothetical protein